jgi:hypothetical protein
MGHTRRCFVPRIDCSNDDDEDNCVQQPDYCETIPGVCVCVCLLLLLNLYLFIYIYSIYMVGINGCMAG